MSVNCLYTCTLHVHVRVGSIETPPMVAVPTTEDHPDLYIPEEVKQFLPYFHHHIKEKVIELVPMVIVTMVTILSTYILHVMNLPFLMCILRCVEAGLVHVYDCVLYTVHVYMYMYMNMTIHIEKTTYIHCMLLEETLSILSCHFV